ncbi:MAG: hypothetical protein EPO36_03730 [Chloroflexota bacterium]|nr:MAG: hypothetical protein EPO36_03730 [Chloroflexota bacterium]
MSGMDLVRLGRTVRALRHRLGWRQTDLGARAGVRQQVVSDIECGRAASVALPRLAAVVAALDADLDLFVRWRGGALDRLLDERHAALCGDLADRLVRLGWEVHSEVSYAYYAERGSIDVLGWHPGARAILIGEVKTELTSTESTSRKHDEKVRLGPRIARDRLGVSARFGIRLLVLPDHSTERRRVARHEAILGRAYPIRGRAAWATLARPTSAASALVFLSPTHDSGARRGPVTRIRARTRTLNGDPTSINS